MELLPDIVGYVLAHAVSGTGDGGKVGAVLPVPAKGGVSGDLGSTPVSHLKGKAIGKCNGCPISPLATYLSVGGHGMTHDLFRSHGRRSELGVVTIFPG